MSLTLCEREVAPAKTVCEAIIALEKAKGSFCSRGLKFAASGWAKRWSVCILPKSPDNPHLKGWLEIVLRSSAASHRNQYCQPLSSSALMLAPIFFVDE